MSLHDEQHNNDRLRAERDTGEQYLTFRERNYGSDRWVIIADGDTWLRMDNHKALKLENWC